MRRLGFAKDSGNRDVITVRALTYAYGIPVNHRAAHGSRITLFLEVPTKEGHVLHVGPE